MEALWPVCLQSSAFAFPARVSQTDHSLRTRQAARLSRARSEAFFSRSPTYADSDVPQLAALIPDKNLLDAKPIPAFNVPRAQYYLCVCHNFLFVLFSAQRLAANRSVLRLCARRDYPFWFNNTDGPNSINYAVVNNFNAPNDPPEPSEPLLFRRAQRQAFAEPQSAAGSLLFAGDRLMKWNNTLVDEPMQEVDSSKCVVTAIIQLWQLCFPARVSPAVSVPLPWALQGCRHWPAV